MQQPRLHGDAAVRSFHESGIWTTDLLVDLFDRKADATPQKAAIVETSRQWKYAEVLEASQNLAAGLARAGIGHGDVVAAQLPNWAELPIIHLATNRIGAIFLPLAPGFGAAETAHLLSISKAKAVFHSATDEERSPARRCVPLRLAVRGADSATGFESLAAESRWRGEGGIEALTKLRATADSPSHVMVSSGSTGMPRCSLYSDNNTAVKLLHQWAPAAGATNTDVSGALAPAGTGSTGYNYPILAMLLIGGTSVLLEQWSQYRVPEALRLLRAHCCSIAVVVPAQLVKLVETAGAMSDPPQLRVITNAGAKLQPQLAEYAEALFGCKVQSIYGSSEAGACTMTSIHDLAEKRRFTVGRPSLVQEVRVLRADGKDARPGEAGEICWRGANKSYGFLNDQESTARVWDADGYMHSGDLGHIDADGYVCISGRIKDMIIRGGQNINPALIEEVLATHPSIQEVSVVGFDDAALGERIAACVVTTDQRLELESLCVLIREHGLAVWNQPERLVLVPELPRNAGGKIDKLSLRRIAQAQG